MESRGSGVFMRSLATRGHLGGLARATPRAIQLLEAFGKDLILLETVGAGQSEVDVMDFADTTLVVCVPGLGDDVQAFKAGIMEIGDVFVVNKAERPGTDETIRELQQMLQMGPRRAWTPPILPSQALSGQGIGEIADAIEAHYQATRQDPDRQTRRLQEAERFVREALQEYLVNRVAARERANGRWQETVAAVAERRLDPLSAARTLGG